MTDTTASRIEHHYLVHSAHVGEAFRLMAVDSAQTIKELAEAEARLQRLVSAGYVRRPPSVPAPLPPKPRPEPL